MAKDDKTDEVMGDADGDENAEQPESIETRPGKITQLQQNSSATGASFQFEDEDHTLGNALRYIVMKNPAVEFCGYSIPHPSENKMNLRIQTYEGTPAEALRKGLADLEDLCDVVTEKFTEERDRFEASQGRA